MTYNQPSAYELKMRKAAADRKAFQKRLWANTPEAIKNRSKYIAWLDGPHN